MKLIAHRGNTQGRVPEKENDPRYVMEKIERGFYVEVDVWYNNGEYFLGHDTGTYAVTENFLENGKLICHAKNTAALHKMLQNKKIHCFWHEFDRYTLTSKGWVWKYPEVYIDGVLAGICSDRLSYE